MRFGVLGPLQVWTDSGSLIEVRERKVRLLLAALLLEPGKVVSTECLIDSLWGSQLPAKPTASVHTKVSQLRRDLEAGETGGRNLVQYESGGYRINIAPRQLDSGQFAQLLEQAAGLTDPHKQVIVLDEALALIRGPSLGDLASEPFALACINCWEELTISAHELRLTARLGLGLHSEVLADLTDLLPFYPRRESLQSLQMQALYGSGRQEEALEAYQRYRHRIDHEAGLRPGPRLNSLYQDILRHDESLVSSKPVQGNLPLPLTNIVGRAEALKDLSEALSQQRLVTLTGPAGVGKTRLAIEAAGHYQQLLGHPVWFIDLAVTAPNVTAKNIAHAVASTIDPDTKSAVEPVPSGAPSMPVEELYRRLPSTEFLLVLDTIEHLPEPAAEFVSQLLATLPQATVVATGRSSLRVPAEFCWQVSPLSLPRNSIESTTSLRELDLYRMRECSAIEFFELRARHVVPTFRVDHQNVREIVDICRLLDGLPVALDLAASHVATMGVNGMVRRLRRGLGLIGSQRRGVPDRHRDVYVAVQWSWDLLSPPDQELLVQLTELPEEATAATIVHHAQQQGIDADQAIHTVARLVELSLLEAVPQGNEVTYRLLHTVRTFLNSQLVPQHLRKRSLV